MLPNWYRNARAYVYCNLTPRILYSRVKYGIRNLITWFPVIWRDRDWDEYFLFVVMHEKLKRMEHLHRHYGMCVDDEKYANQMRTCRILIKRLMDENYFDYSLLPKTGCFEDMLKPLPPELSRKIMVEHKKEELQINQDLDLLFKTMRKHIQKWWD